MVYYYYDLSKMYKHAKLSLLKNFVNKVGSLLLKDFTINLVNILEAFYLHYNLIRIFQNESYLNNLPFIVKHES